jgi:rubredoxin-NAD+ reductase
MTINDLADYARFRNAVSRENPAPIVLLGAGLIGCEFANDLAGAGFNVHVVTLGEAALAPLLPVEFGHALQMALGTLGVQWHCNTSIATVEKCETAFTVTLANGTQMVTQAVLSATGLRPNIELAVSAGIKTNRGITVNQFMETSAPSVFAIGDCAERDGTVLPYVLPLMNQARAVAKTVAGIPTPVIYPIMPVVVKTPIHPISFVLPSNASGRWDIKGDLTGKKCLLLRDDGKLLGFALSGSANNDKAALVKLLSTNT